MLLATGSGLIGWTALRPESWMDFDPLYRGAVSRPPPPFSDFTSMTVDLPRDLSVARSLHAGGLANWNPLSACGTPLWAEQGGPFFPLKLPFYAAPSPRTFDVFLALRLVAAGLGAYLLARYRGRPHLPGVAAGATFALSGAMIEAFTFAASSALFMLPWVLLGAAAIVRRRDGRAVANAAVALGVTASGGHPTLIMLGFTAFAVALLADLTRQWRAPARALAIAAGGGLAALLGLALAAPSLLPLAELMPLSTSYKYKPLGDAAWSLALTISRHMLPLALFAPSVLGALHERLALTHTAAAALGVSTLVLAVAGVLRGGLDRALLAVAVLGVAITTAPPGLAWIAHLPGLRYLLPYYAWTLVALPLTQAAGVGVEGLATTRGRRAALLALLLILAGFASLALVGDPATPFGVQHFATALRTALAADGGRARLLVPPALAAVAVAACFALSRTRAAAWGPLAFVALAIAEQLVLSRPWLELPRSAVADAAPSPAVRFLQEHLADGDGRFVGSPVSLGFGLTSMLYGLPDLRGAAGLHIERFQEYVAAAQPTGSDAVHLTISQLRSPLLDLAAVRYLAFEIDGQEPPPLSAFDPELTLAYRDAGVAIFENRAALPRARIAHRAQLVADQAAADDAIAALARQPGHAAALGFAERVILEPDAAGGSAPALDADPPDGDESVRIVDQRDPDALQLEAQLGAPGFVVVADTYYPGWRATVDGAPAPIYPADLLFRAVYVPAGRHTIDLRYAPRPLMLGWWVAAAAGAACVVLARLAPRAA